MTLMRTPARTFRSVVGTALRLLPRSQSCTNGNFGARLNADLNKIGCGPNLALVDVNLKRSLIAASNL